MLLLCVVEPPVVVSLFVCGTVVVPVFIPPRSNPVSTNPPALFFPSAFAIFATAEAISVHITINAIPIRYFENVPFNSAFSFAPLITYLMPIYISIPTAIAYPNH